MSIKYILSLIALVAMTGITLGANVITLGNDINVLVGNYELVEENNQYAQGVVDKDTGAAVVLMVPLGALILSDCDIKPSEVKGWVWASNKTTSERIGLVTVTDMKNVVLVFGISEKAIVDTASRVGDI